MEEEVNGLNGKAAREAGDPSFFDRKYPIDLCKCNADHLQATFYESDLKLTEKQRLVKKYLVKHSYLLSKADFSFYFRA
ncbi:MAG TPA: hypothetical protein VGO50_11280 [Pyrinomonadaceae bacterium]|nr:hypothetical protein [Pyrinomonadaceae bacterium]